MNILSLDIGHREINYAIYRRLPSPFYFLTGNPFGFPEFIKEIRKGFTTHDALPSLLEELKKKESIDYLILGLPFYRFSHHIIDLPIRSEQEIRTALAFELEKRLPMPVDQYIYNFTVLKKTEEGSTILCLSIRKDALSNIIEPLKGSAIPIAGIFCTFATTVIHAARKNRGRILMAEQDGEYIYLACLLDSEIKALRLIRRDEDIEYPFGFHDPSIPKYLLRSSDIPHSNLSPEDRDSRLNNYQTIEINTTEVITKYATHGLQFIPEELKTLLKDIRLKVAGILTGVAAAIFLFTDLIALYKEKKALDHFIHITEEIKELKSNGPLEERTLLLSRYSEMRAEALKLLSGLKRSLPSGTVLNSINIDIQNRTLEIEGKTLKSTSVLQALEESGLFKNISYSGAITMKEGKEVFRFRMEIR